MMRGEKHHGSRKPHGWLLALGLTVVSCGGDAPTVTGPPGPLPPGPPATPPPSATAISMVSGDAQQAKAGERLGEPLVVQVSDANGQGVAGFFVTWSVASGAGVVVPADTTYTDADGRARVFFEPTALGRSTLSASANGPSGVGALAGSPVTFTVEATTLVIEIGGDRGWCWDPEFFSGPDHCTGDVSVPVGTTVEWVTRLEGERGGWRASVTSTSAPPAGEAFDSGTLYRGQRFQFVPQVAGTWEYVDEFSGQTGRLTAR